jgi:hypothetical protein
MQTLILKSDNKTALEAIKTLAKVLDIESSMNENEKENDFIIEKGVKISKPKRKFNAREMAGSLTDLNFEEPSVIRKKAWTRKKAY